MKGTMKVRKRSEEHITDKASIGLSASGTLRQKVQQLQRMSAKKAQGSKQLLLSTDRKVTPTTKRVQAEKAGFSPEMVVMGGDLSLPVSIQISKNPSQKDLAQGAVCDAEHGQNIVYEVQQMQIFEKNAACQYQGPDENTWHRMRNSSERLLKRKNATLIQYPGTETRRKESSRGNSSSHKLILGDTMPASPQIAYGSGVKAVENLNRSEHLPSSKHSKKDAPSSCQLVDVTPHPIDEHSIAAASAAQRLAVAEEYQTRGPKHLDFMNDFRANAIDNDDLLGKLENDEQGPYYLQKNGNQGDSNEGSPFMKP